MRSLTRALQRLPQPDPVARRLDRARTRKLVSLERSASERIARARALTTQGAEAHAELEGIVDGLLRELRASGTLAERWIDAAVATREPEILDGVVPSEARHGAMNDLDRLNRFLGSYEQWTSLVRARLRPGGHVHELATGHAGFARHLATHARDLRVSASDLDPEHIELARRESDGVPLELSVRDATDLRELRDVDLFVFTQAAHHFGPALLTRVIAEAMRRAPNGVLLIDVHRAGLLVPFAGLVQLAVRGGSIVFWDGMRSVRRGYTPAELRLFALCAGADRIEARALGVAHLVLHAARSERGT